MKHQNIAKSAKLQQGLTLIEILVTVLVLAIGMLGMAAMQSTSIKLSYESYLRTQASLLSYDLIDRIRANSGEVYLLNLNEVPSRVVCVGENVNCNPRDLVRADLYAWYQNAIAIFPDSQFELTEFNNDYVLRISWLDRYEQDEKQGEAEQFIFNFEGY